MKDPSIAAFWLITMPQIMGGFSYDEDVKQKIWWQYKVCFTLLHSLYLRCVYSSLIKLDLVLQ